MPTGIDKTYSEGQSQMFLEAAKLSPWGTVTVSTLRGRFLAYQGRIFNILPCTDQLA